MRVAQLLYEQAVAEGIIGKYLQSKAVVARAVLKASGELAFQPAQGEEAVPVTMGRGVNPAPYSWCDFAQYVMGHNPGNPDRGRKCFNLFWEKALSEARSAGDDDLRAAVCALLARPDALAEARKSLPALLKASPKADKGLIVVYLDGDGHNASRRPAMDTYFKSKAKVATDRADGGDFCCITGIPAAPVRVHPKVNGIPGTSGGGIPPFSWNERAYTFDGREKGDNIFVGEDAAVAVKLVIERIMGVGEHKDRRTSAGFGDGRSIIWFSPARDMSFLTDLVGFDYDEKRTASAWDAILDVRGSDDPVHFMAVKGAAGRWGVSDFGSTTASDLSKSLLQLKECFDSSECGRWNGPLHVGFTVRQAYCVPPMSSMNTVRLTMSILLGRPVPRAIQPWILSMRAWGGKVKNPRAFLSSRAFWSKFIQLRERENHGDPG